jgi:hypothetical protein
MTSPDSDELEGILREPDPPLPDAGFTTRVLSALPRAEAPWGHRRLVLLGMTLLGCILGLSALVQSAVLDDLLRAAGPLPQNGFLCKLLIICSIAAWWLASVLLTEAISRTLWTARIR